MVHLFKKPAMLFELPSLHTNPSFVQIFKDYRRN